MVEKPLNLQDLLKAGRKLRQNVEAQCIADTEAIEVVMLYCGSFHCVMHGDQRYFVMTNGDAITIENFLNAQPTDLDSAELERRTKAEFGAKVCGPIETAARMRVALEGAKAYLWQPPDGDLTEAEMHALRPGGTA